MGHTAIFFLLLVSLFTISELGALGTYLPIVIDSTSHSPGNGNIRDLRSNTYVNTSSVLQNSSALISPSLAPNSSTEADGDACVAYDSINSTIYVCGGSTNLSTINQIISNSSVLNRTTNRNWILNADILIENGATLFINSTDTSWLKINSTAGNAHSIVVHGNLIVDKTRISSWNSASNTEAVSSENSNRSLPRSYLLMHWGGTGQMNITNSIISGLGFNGLKDTWGISYYSGSGSILQNNTISNNFRGIYLTTNATDVLIGNNTIQNSLQHGLNLYKSKDIEILDNEISGNKHHGVFCTRECENILIGSNHIVDNNRNGIVLNQDTTNSTVKQNALEDNNGSAIAIWNSSNIIVDDNMMLQNRLGLTIAHNSSNNIVNKNSITDSLTNGIILDDESTNNSIKQNVIAHSRGSGVYVRNTLDNALGRNNITENSRSGVVLLNTTGNYLEQNNVSANTPYNYYIRQNSTYNIIRNTYFDNSTLRFFDNSSNIVLENTDNRIIANNKKIPVNSYPSNATFLIQPTSKNVLVNTLNMFAVPSEENVQIFSIGKDFNANQEYKKWMEKSPLPSNDKKASTRYIIGNFPPDAQVMISVNDSFWNAYTSNSSGHIDFVYDGYSVGSPAGADVDADTQSYRVLEFKAETSNRPAISTIVFFSSLVAGSTTFILLRRYLKKKKG